MIVFYPQRALSFLHLRSLRITSLCQLFPSAELCALQDEPFFVIPFFSSSIFSLSKGSNRKSEKSWIFDAV